MERHRCSVCGNVREGFGGKERFICFKCAESVSAVLDALKSILDERYQRHDEPD